MHIDTLIQRLLEALPAINSEVQAKSFLQNFELSDQMALVTAYYIGNKHLHENELMPDTGRLHRTLHDHIEHSEYADIIHKKRFAISDAMNSFLRCTTQQQRNDF
ncbi:hypothetical protein L8T13_21210 [Enterobacter roggenkampii]|uniref:hypothetical protein n=1 Tax=Enterobacter cloacae complex TaxID=354276 RepID=UPI00200364F8|nr:MULTISPECIES: hypothetical protein [Enterobacter cloacae complex]MCK6951933.1 hypothetical protein [Enterobacter roggenkampii]MDN4964049.1 hypothetical protein [Enterobacter hormaechei]MDO6155607.1 hypothetical protein [Enterobacter hormaechei]